MTQEGKYDQHDSLNDNSICDDKTFDVARVKTLAMERNYKKPKGTNFLYYKFVL